MQGLKLEVQTLFILKLAPVSLSLTCHPVQKEECSLSLQYLLTGMITSIGLIGNGLLGHDYIDLRVGCWQ